MASANDLAPILEEFRDRYTLAQEIWRLRYLREREEAERVAKLPKIIPVYIVFKREGGCYDVTFTKPNDDVGYHVAYQPINEE